jgi:hypothetical protein
MGPDTVPNHASSGGTVPAAPAAQPAAVSFSSAELRNLLAPIALYPDPLLAQILPASAYPLQIVLAEHWLDRNRARVAKGDFSGVDSQNWDPSVKALARFPAIIKRMSDDLEWTIDLGDAEVNQPFNVAEVIQQLRAEAEKAGSLKTTPEQTVTISSGGGESLIVIEPAEPSTIYVPNYDWAAAYGSPERKAAPGSPQSAHEAHARPRPPSMWKGRTDGANSASAPHHSMRPRRHSRLNVGLKAGSPGERCPRSCLRHTRSL